MSAPQETLGTLGIHLLLVAAVCLTIFPLVWMLMASVMPAGEASA
jgi:ABC-type glycerol-3-phosphate transport system permease component